MSENRTRFRLDQRRAPIYEALEQFRQMRVVPFDVPGHKRGRGNPELTAFLGQQCVGVDVNSMKPLDNLCHPVSVIREAEELAADAFGAAHAFLMVGGTTSSVQSMVLTACKRGDEIILPRNVHRSVLNALVLCGAVPVYVNPEVDKRLGAPLCGWPTTPGCSAWPTRLTAPTSTLAAGCLFPPWQPVPIWLLSPCTRAAAA